jgi:predicted permease
MNESIEKIENTTNVSKIKQVGGIVLFFTIIFAIILGIFKILAYF